MSVELWVFIRDEALPTWQEWQRALDEAGSGLHMDEFSPREHAGFVPGNLDGHECGFEYFWEAIEPGEGEEVLAEIGDRTRTAVFVWHGSEMDWRAGTLAAAVLTKLADGVFFDPQSGEFARGGDVFTMLEQQEQDERGRRLRLAERKWGQTTSRRCPECRRHRALNIGTNAVCAAMSWVEREAAQHRSVQSRNGGAARHSFWYTERKPAMNIIFCSDDFDRRKPDEAYASEVAAVERVGGQYSLVNFDALVNDGDAFKAVRRVPESPKPTGAIYRGWLLKPSAYSHLYEALAAKGVRLVNDPAAYVHCHYLPESYSVIERWTPRSAWTKIEGAVDMDRIMELLRPFGGAPLVMKDFVKSRKHEWDEACYISSASDRSSVEKVVRRFLDFVEDDLNEGLVFREFVEFEPLTQHSKSGMPLTKEFRLFFLDGKPIFWTEY